MSLLAVIADKVREEQAQIYEEIRKSIQSRIRSDNLDWTFVGEVDINYCRRRLFTIKCPYLTRMMHRMVGSVVHVWKRENYPYNHKYNGHKLQGQTLVVQLTTVSAAKQQTVIAYLMPELGDTHFCKNDEKHKTGTYYDHKLWKEIRELLK